MPNLECCNCCQSIQLCKWTYIPQSGGHSDCCCSSDIDCDTLDHNIQPDTLQC